MPKILQPAGGKIIQKASRDQSSAVRESGTDQLEKTDQCQGFQKSQGNGSTEIAEHDDNGKFVRILCGRLRRWQHVNYL
jgi:hypothetical protein